MNDFAMRFPTGDALAACEKLISSMRDTRASIQTHLTPCTHNFFTPDLHQPCTLVSHPTTNLTPHGYGNAPHHAYGHGRSFSPYRHNNSRPRQQGMSPEHIKLLDELAKDNETKQKEEATN